MISRETTESGGIWPSPEEMIRRMSRLVSPRTGIIRKVLSTQVAEDDPLVYRAWSDPADVTTISGYRALNRGAAASTSPLRAALKAAGESIERYCSAQYDDSTLTYSTWNELGENAIRPSRFVLFSNQQYATSGFRFQPASDDAVLGWTPTHSLTTGTDKMVPAAFVFVPYRYAHQSEARISDSISTGLACGPNIAAAAAKGLLEVIERDAFMLTWHRQTECQRLDVNSVENTTIRALVAAIRDASYRLDVLIITQDIAVPVMLAVCTTTTDAPPFAVIGLGADLDPERAVLLCLEEAALGLLGMRQLANAGQSPVDRGRFEDPKTLEEHGLRYALVRESLRNLEFFGAPTEQVSLSALRARYPHSDTKALQEIVHRLKAASFEALVSDVTTEDISEVGLRVVRGIVPGLQPLDNDHTARHLGGTRIGSVDGRREGRFDRKNNFLNDAPHPFP